MMIKKIMGKAWILLAFTLPFPSMSYASDADSLQKLSRAKRYVERRGVSCRNHADGRYLSQNRYYVLPTTLYSENIYLIIAAGDSSVRDLDLVVLDDNYREVAVDGGANTIPIVKVNPRWTDTFYIAMVMSSGYGYANFLVCFEKK